MRAIVPAALFLSLMPRAGFLEPRKARSAASPPDREPLRAGERACSLADRAGISASLLLGGVATGRIYAVEGAATGAFVLFVAGRRSRTPTSLPKRSGRC